jgi:hypothetical protein
MATIITSQRWRMEKETIASIMGPPLRQPRRYADPRSIVIVSSRRFGEFRLDDEAVLGGVDIALQDAEQDFDLIAIASEHALSWADSYIILDALSKRLIKQSSSY